MVKPNIIYVMVDDLGYGEVGCYGQEKIPTPNIDRLAKEGVKFTRFYAASPVCAPTRASLMTGLHQGHAPVRGNKENGGFGFNDAEGQSPLPSQTLTVAEHLKANGYTTGIIGKWGLGGPKAGETPMDHGFDFFYGYLCQRRAHNHYPTYLWKNYQPDLLQNKTYNAHQKVTSVPTDLNEYASLYGGKDYAHAKCLTEGKHFIKSAKGKPFFLYYASTIPHAALQAPPEWIAKFPTEWDTKPYLGEQGYLPTPRPRATYAAMIAYLDYSRMQGSPTIR
jgi:arylsulfatase A